jgi:hypothetical protein
MSVDENVIQIDDDLWCLNSHFMSLGCEGSLRMSILKVGPRLLIYSPVKLQRKHIDQIREIGEVGAIVAPNLYHHLFLRDCITIFGAARVFVPEGLVRKIGPIDRAEVVTHRALTEFGPGLDSFTLNGHRIQETLLYHGRSRSLLTADLIYNYASEHNFAEKQFFRLVGGYGRPTLPFYHRFAIRDKRSVREMVKTVARWPVQRLVMSHGRIVTASDAGPLFTTAWRRLIEP